MYISLTLNISIMKLINMLSSFVSDFREWLFLKSMRSSFKH